MFVGDEGAYDSVAFKLERAHLEFVTADIRVHVEVEPWIEHSDLPGCSEELTALAASLDYKQRC